MNNPQAFPTLESVYEGSNYTSFHQYDGMTLMDWYAGQFLSGVAADSNMPSSAKTAELAYDFAEAMLVERAKRMA